MNHKSCLTIGVAFFLSSLGYAAEHAMESEKDYSLRSIGHLRIINPKGDVTVQGWAFDRVRIRLKKKVTAETAEKAKATLAGVDYRFQVVDKDIEISTQYGDGLSIQDRLREKENPKAIADLVVFAPSKLKLHIWVVNGKANLKGWNGSAEIRSNSGTVRVEGVNADRLDVTCPSCAIQVKNVKGAIKCIGREGAVDLSHIHGKSIYAETDSGSIKLTHIQGDQLYTSKSGSIDGQFLTGKIGFSTQKGGVDLREISGFLSGSAESGNIVAKIKNWTFADKAFIESEGGNIDLTLPRSFSGDVDIWSMRGKTNADFAIERTQESSTFGPEPSNHLIGRIKEGGELLKIFSDSGNVHVFKGKL